VFENHYTEADQSGIAYAALFSGSQADHHGIYPHPQELGDEVRLIFEAFAERGWETFYWNDHFASSPKLNYAQGVPVEHRYGGPLGGDDEHFRALLDRLHGDP